MTIKVREVTPHDRDAVLKILQEYWGERRIVSRGVVHDASELPGVVAEIDSSIVGLLTYRMAQEECEIVSLNALSRLKGIGSALLGYMINQAQAKHSRRIWLITTNDNMDALRFYQRRGFSLVAVHRNALQVSRKFKPAIPAEGEHGIPLRDEIELEIILRSAEC